jgi:membrane-associated phospholipid phosphatase
MLNRKNKNLLKLLSLIGLQTVVYFFIGKFNETPFQLERTLTLSLPFDHAVPFLPLTIWSYCLYYIICLSGVFLTDDEEIFPKVFESFLILTVASDLMFVFLPVSVPLSSPMPGTLDPVTQGLWKTVIGIDTRSNCFPSLHCGHSFLMSYWFWKSRNTVSYAPFVTIATLLVAISTLTIKQHWLLDVVGAVIFTAPLMRFYEKRIQYQQI